jgi:concanavalin A-like lectin/glucanase superfamily protein
MALLFDGIDDHCIVTVPIGTAYPITVEVWFNPDTTVSGVLAGVFDTATDNDRWQLQYASTTLNFTMITAGASSTAASANAPTTGIWNHGCGIFTSATSRRCVLNGDWANSGVDTGSKTFPAGLDQTVIGRRMSATNGLPFDGRIAEVTIWDVAFTQAEVEASARGCRPLRLRTGNRLGHWRLGLGAGGAEPDWSGNHNNMTVSGALVADHVPLGPDFGFDLGWQGLSGAAAVSEFVRSIPAMRVPSLIG